MLVRLEDPRRLNASFLFVDDVSCFWRKAKKEEFEERLAKLGSENLHAVELLHKLQAETVALDDLHETLIQQVHANLLFVYAVPHKL